MPLGTTKPGKPRARRRTAKEDGPDPIDVHVGRQLRLARDLAGLTQVEIGKDLGMSFQVVQKYEQGEIRVSASRLFQLAVLLRKPVTYFFEGIETREPAGAMRNELGRREVELVRAYRTVGNPELQQRILQLIRDMAQAVPGASGNHAATA
jgi:transcriptional regulator with XRE-family HTH domain